MKTKNIYIWIIIIAFALLSAAVFFKDNVFVANLLSLLATGGIASFFYQIYHHARAEEHEREMQEKRDMFELGASSHMANTAFNKHLKFCEEYIKCVDDGISSLYRNGPSVDVGKTFTLLMEIRRKYAIWINKNIGDNLRPFENALMDMFQGENRLKSLPVGEKRTKVVEETSALFEKILITKEDDKEKEKELKRDYILDHLQRVLGIDKLYILRQEILDRAIAEIMKKNKK
jgi:hypothetical protein